MERELEYLGRADDAATLHFDTLVTRGNHVIGARGHAGHGIFPSVIRLLASGRVLGGFGLGGVFRLSGLDGGLARVDRIHRPRREAEAKAVFGTTDLKHPGVSYLMQRSGDVYIGGKLRGFKRVRNDRLLMFAVRMNAKDERGRRVHL